MSGTAANNSADLATSTSEVVSTSKTTEAGQDDVSPSVAVEDADKNAALHNMSPNEVIC